MWRKFDHFLRIAYDHRTCSLSGTGRDENSVEGVIDSISSNLKPQAMGLAI